MTIHLPLYPTQYFIFTFLPLCKIFHHVCAMCSVTPYGLYVEYIVGCMEYSRGCMHFMLTAHFNWQYTEENSNYKI